VNVTYLLLKVLHVASVVLFVGNIVTGVFWKLHGDARGDLRAREQALSGVIASDRLFTVPGVVLIIVSGVWMGFMAHIPLLSTLWSLWGIILFSVSGLLFTARVQPLQRRMLANVRAGLTGEWDAAGYRRMSSAWAVWGGIATALPLAVIALMVLKPT
jgi:uncharacterized membrane protein